MNARHTVMLARGDKYSSRLAGEFQIGSERGCYGTRTFLFRQLMHAEWILLYVAQRRGRTAVVLRRNSPEPDFRQLRTKGGYEQRRRTFNAVSTNRQRRHLRRGVVDRSWGSLAPRLRSVRTLGAAVQLAPELARERSRGLHPRVRRGTALSLQHRWWGILSIALQRSVAGMVANADTGADLATGQLEPSPALCDLDMVA